MSPSGRMIAVASFQMKKCYREIENLKTDVYVMDMDSESTGMGRGRRLVITDGGWPSWGSDDVIFFHRGIDEEHNYYIHVKWGVFQYRITTKQEIRIIPEGIDAMTPAAICETKVAVATLRQKHHMWSFMVPRGVEQYRHMEIFDAKDLRGPVGLTVNIRPRADHFNPFVPLQTGQSTPF